jgi:DNA modification methylase
MIYTGDCLELIKSIDLSSVDAIVADPPYGMKCDTDGTRFSGGSGRAERGKRWSPIIGDDKPFDPTPWLQFPKVVLFGFNHFASKLPIGTTLVWTKRRPEHYGTFLSDAELAWMKGGHGVYCHFAGNSNGKGRCHPTQKPVSVMEFAIGKLKLKPGSTILDPYCGSGTTGVAAVRMGFNFVGIEIDPDFAETARPRVAAAQPAGAVR